MVDACVLQQRLQSRLNSLGSSGHRNRTPFPSSPSPRINWALPRFTRVSSAFLSIGTGNCRKSASKRRHQHQHQHQHWVMIVKDGRLGALTCGVGQVAVGDLVEGHDTRIQPVRRDLQLQSVRSTDFGAKARGTAPEAYPVIYRRTPFLGFPPVQQVRHRLFGRIRRRLPCAHESCISTGVLVVDQGKTDRCSS